MAIGQSSTVARYKQNRPIQLKTGDELDKYFARQDAAIGKARADRDARRKSADKIAAASKLELPDAKHKWQQVIGQIHADTVPKLSENLRKQQDLRFQGKDGSPEYYELLSNESQIRSTLPKWEAAFNAMEQAQGDLSQGIEDGTYSKSRNIGLLGDLTGMYTGKKWNYADGKIRFEGPDGKLVAMSPTEIQSAPTIFGDPKNYYDWDGKVTDIAEKIGTIKTQFEDPSTGIVITKEQTKDLGKLRGTLRDMIDADPDFLEEYQASMNGFNASDDELVTEEDLIDEIIEEVNDRYNMFADTSSSTRYESQGKTTPKSYVEGNIQPQGTSNGVIFDSKGNAIQFTNPTQNYLDLAGVEKTSSTGNLNNVMFSYTDKNEVTFDDEAYSTREIIPWNKTVQGFKPNGLSEQQLYSGPPIFIRGLKAGAEIPEGKDPKEYMKAKTRFWSSVGQSVTPDAWVTDVKNIAYGTVIKPGQYLPQGLIDDVSSGNVIVYNADSSGSPITDQEISIDQMNENSEAIAVVKGVDENNLSMDIPVNSDNYEFLQTVNSNTKGYINEYLSQTGRSSDATSFGTKTDKNNVVTVDANEVTPPKKEEEVAYSKGQISGINKFAEKEGITYEEAVLILKENNRL